MKDVNEAPVTEAEEHEAQTNEVSPAAESSGSLVDKVSKYANYDRLEG